MTGYGGINNNNGPLPESQRVTSQQAVLTDHSGNRRHGSDQFTSSPPKDREAEKINNDAIPSGRYVPFLHAELLNPTANC